MFLTSLRRSTYLLLALIVGSIAYSAATTRFNPRLVQFNGAWKRGFTSSSSSSTSVPNYADLSSKYTVAVAFQPKDRERNTLISEHFNDKNADDIDSPTGEDNYLVAKGPSDGSSAVGVADGVGGWADLGFDSSAISRELCKNIASLFTNGYSDDPKSLLEEAFDVIKKEKIVKVGGTTSCVGVLHPDGRLNVANLGDSWAGLFRNNKLIVDTKVQTHAFNTPYQLAIIPDSILNRQGGSSKFIMDEPKHADEYECKLEKGDVVLFATDGVIDNIDVKDIEIFLQDNEKTDLDLLAKDFVNKVNKLSLDENFPSVFSQELSKITGQHYSGGKEDDITVVFVRVN